MQSASRAAYNLGITTEDTTQALLKAMEDGKLMAEEFLPELSKELMKSANAGGALEAAMNSTGAAIGRFRTNVFLANKTLNEAGLDRGVRDFMNTMSNAIMRAEPLWETLGKTLSVVMSSLEGPIEFFGMLGDKLGLAMDDAGNFTTQFKLLTAAVVVAVKPFRKIAAALFLMGLFIPAITDTIDEGFSSWSDFFTKMAIWAAGVALLAKSLRSLGGAYSRVRSMFGKGAEKLERSPEKRSTTSSVDAPETEKPKSSTLKKIGKAGMVGWMMTELVGAFKGGEGEPLMTLKGGREVTMESLIGSLKNSVAKPNLEPLLGAGGGMQPGQLPFGNQMLGDINIHIEGDDPKVISEEVINTINNMFRETSLSETSTEK